jgi:hypothetical protein
MGNIVIALGAEIRWLGMEISSIESNLPSNLVEELMSIQGNLLKARSGIEVEVGLWYLWLALEEIMDQRHEIHPAYKAELIGRVTKIQSMAFRLSQRYSFVGGKHAKNELPKRPRIKAIIPGTLPSIPAVVAMHEPENHYFPEVKPARGK